MPTKNRPKRFNRNVSVRVARRKRKQADRLAGNKRVRNPRPKNKVNDSILLPKKPDTSVGTGTKTSKPKAADNQKGMKEKVVKKKIVKKEAKKDD